MKPVATLFTLALAALSPSLVFAAPAKAPVAKSHVEVPASKGKAVKKAAPTRVASSKSTKESPKKVAAKHVEDAEKQSEKIHLAKVAAKRVIDDAEKLAEKARLEKVAAKRVAAVVAKKVDDALSERHAETHGEPSEVELEKLATDSSLQSLPRLVKVSTKHEIPSAAPHKASGTSKEKDAKAGHTKVEPKSGKLAKVAARTEVPETSELPAKVAAAAVDSILHDVEGQGAPSAEDARKTAAGCGVELVVRHDGKEESIPVKACDGKVIPGALEKIAVLVGEAKGHDGLDPRLLGRVAEIATHFQKNGKLPQIEILGGSKNANSSMHKDGKALDLRLLGVKNEEVAAFCKTLSDTGCGFYPKAKFVHVDVRDLGTGKVSWIDAAAPGEAPRYVLSYPEKVEANEKSNKSTSHKSAPSKSRTEKAPAKKHSA